MESIFFDSDCLAGRPGRSEDAIDHARRGGVALIRGALQEIGFADRLRELTLAEAARHATAEQVDALRKQGFERIHQILDAQQLYNLNVGLADRMKLEAATLIRVFAERLLNYDRRVFIMGTPVVRFFVPHDVYAANRKLFEIRQGFLKIQGPHHDTWFDHATESLNIWIAIGRVLRGNGLIVYPDNWGRYLHHDGSRRMPRSQNLGRSINFDLDPGDVLFFHGEILHSSELNVTDETRYVLTNRFTLVKPKFKEFHVVYRWYDSSLLGTKLEGLATWPTYLSTAFVRYNLSPERLRGLWSDFWKYSLPVRAVKKVGRIVLARFRAPTDGLTPTAEPKPQVVRARDNGEPSANGEPNANVDPSPSSWDDMQVGDIRALSRNRCVVKTEEGMVAFSRFCSHEGADLVNAAYVDGKIRCPWHNLTYDARSGRQPCTSLKGLKVESFDPAASAPIPAAEIAE